jgi:predicted dehydrogenase
MSRVRIGLIGYGSWAERVHIPSIALSANAELAAVAGPDAARAEAMARQHGARYGASDPLTVIGDPSIDAVLVCSPNDAHPAAVLAAAAAGKHVLCEKPLARTLAEARGMAEAVRSAGVRHMTAFTWRHVPAARLMRDLAAAGEIGRLLHAEAHFLHGGWLKLDARRPWRFDRRRMGSGILGDLGVHVFDLLAWMAGRPISRACARLATLAPQPGTPGQPPVFDDGHLLLEFAPDGAGAPPAAGVRISRVAVSSSQPPFPEMHQGVALYGETGALLYDLHRHSQVELRRPKAPARLIDAPDPLPATDDEGTITREIGRRQIEAFAQGVLSGAAIQPSFEDGLRAQAVMDAAERAHDAGAWAAAEAVEAA